MINQNIKKFVLPFILVIGLFMRLPHLGGSLWLDEAAQALESSRALGEQYKIKDDFQPPLLHYIVHMELRVSKNEAFLRSVSMLAGLLSIALLYVLLKDSVGEEAAVVGALLLALNPFHIFFSQELRPYALATSFACLSWLSLLQQKKKWYIVATVGGLYCMYLYPFVMLSQCVYYAFEQRKQLRWYIANTSISALFFIPWLPFFFEQLKAGMTLAKILPGWASAVATPQLKALPLTLAKFVVGQVELKDSVLYMLLAGSVVCLSAVSLVLAWKKKQTRFLVYWFLIPILASWLISFFIPIIQPKRVMLVLPALMGTMSLLFVQKSLWKRRLRFAGYLIMSIFLFMSYLYFITPKYQRENWRDLIAIIEASARGTSAIAVFAFPESFAPWRWYADGSVGSLASSRLRIDDVSQLQSFSMFSGYNRIFVFDYLRDLTDPHRKIEEWMSLSGNRQIGLIDGGNVGFVRVYTSVYNKMAHK